MEAMVINTVVEDNLIKIPDAIIAVTAKFHGIPLYTFNKKDFKFIPVFIDSLVLIPVFHHQLHAFIINFNPVIW